MKKLKICIIGGGNLGVSIAEGLIKSSLKLEKLTVTKRRTKAINKLKKIGINVSDDNKKSIKEKDLIFLAVKPNQSIKVLNEIKDCIDIKKQIIVSLVTGLSSEKILHTLNKKAPIFRVMPNTAIALQESMTCISSKNANKKQCDLINSVFSILGKTMFVKENLISASTVLAASGVAFSLRFMRAIIQAGIEIGFEPNDSKIIAAQVMNGASKLIIESSGDNHPEMEIDKVTTPQGITISGLNTMEHNGFSSALIKGVLTSFNKIEKMKK